MKIKKLLLTAVLSAGLLVAPLAQAWPVSLYILFSEKNNHLNVLIGDCHATNSKDENEKNFIKASKAFFEKLLMDKNVAFIIEGNKEEAIKRYPDDKKTPCSYLQELVKNALDQKKFNAQLKLSDWRDKKIGTLLHFFIYDLQKELRRLKKSYLKTIKKNYKETKTTKTTYSKKIEKIYEKALKAEPTVFINSIQEKINTFDEPTKKELKKNNEDFIKTIQNHANEKDFSLKQLEEQFEQICGEAEESIYNDTPNRKALSGEIIKKLRTAYSKIEKLHGCSQERFLERMLNQAIYEINGIKLSTLSENEIMQAQWFDSLITSLGDYGFAMGIKTSYPQHPVTITYTGNEHTQALTKHFIEEEKYEVFYEVSDKYKPLSPNDFKEFFKKLDEAREKIRKDEKKESDNEKSFKKVKRTLFEVDETDKELDGVL